MSRLAIRKDKITDGIDGIMSELNEEFKQYPTFKSVITSGPKIGLKVIM